MTDKQMKNLLSQPIPAPYLVSATDQFYGVTPSFETKEKKMPLEGKKRTNLRILITTFWNYPAIGGLQNYISTLAMSLEQLGHTVDIIAPNQFPKDTIKVIEKKISSETKQFYNTRYGCFSTEIVKQNVRLSSYEMMLRNMDLEEYDIFHAQDRFTANILGRLNVHYQKPLFFTPHGFMTHRKLQSNLIEKGSVEETYFLALDKKAMESSIHMVILCDAFRPILKNMGIEDSKMSTVYSGIDFRLENTGKDIKSSENKTVISCISRLRPRKGHKHLFEALNLIKSECKNVDVWIIGDGEMREQLEDQVKSLGLDNVFFLGARKDIPQLLSKSDIFVLPTTSDTLPLAVIEAMSAEKAILTTNCGGIPEIVKDQYSGLIVEPKDAHQLSEKLLLLLKDIPLRENLAKNAKSFADNNLTSTAMVKKIEKIYQSFLWEGEI